MDLLQFTQQDCDDVLKHCPEFSDVQTVDFEIIPRHDNYILIVTTERNHERVCLFVKSKAESPVIHRILSETSMITFVPTITPKLYCGKSELLFFEDLTSQKFQTSPELFGLKHIQQVYRVLARFHAAAFAYERSSGRKLNEEYQLEVNNNDETKLKELGSMSPRVLCHSNLKLTNILFHYANGVPDKCKLLNFKASYASPAYDVLQVVLFNTTEDFRKCHLEEALCFYYDRWAEELKALGLSVETVLTLEEFKSCCERILPLVKLEPVLLSQ